ncbi:MAG: hypothetical protein J7M38_01560 [Armatimonadetes bacterium]|nr:hypothetical protein [Armatimonadota bacterium]
MKMAMRSLLFVTVMVVLVGGMSLIACAQEAGEFVQPPFPPDDGIYRFDFGKPESGVGEGWYRVLPTTTWSAEQGFGYTEGRARAEAFDQNRRVIRDTLQLDDVTRDGIYGGTPFRVDLPDGVYTVVLLAGQFSRPGPNRPYSHYESGKISAGGVTLYEQINDPKVFFDPHGRYFHNYYRDWHPDVDLYEVMIEPWIPMSQAEVQVTGGSLEISATRYAPINALMIFPAEREAEGRAAVEQFKRRQHDFFNRQYTWLPDEPQWEMPGLPADMRDDGAVLYVCDNPGALRTSTRPVPRDLGRPLRLFASYGEREFGCVAVTPLEDIEGDISFSVSDLTGEAGTLPASAFDIRYLRYGEYPVTGGYVVKPHFLVPWMPDRFEEGLTRGFWVDLIVPDDAQPGFYSGTLRLTGPGLDASLPIQVRILPLDLPMSRCHHGVYAGDLTGTTFRHYRMNNKEKFPWDLAVQVERTRTAFFADCGFTGFFDSLPWYPLEFDDEGNVVPTDTWEWYLTVFRIAAEFPEFRERIFCYYLGGPQLFPKCPAYLSIRKADKLPLDEIVFPDEAVEQMSALTRYLYEHLRAEGLPELTFYVFDELGNHGAKGARWGREMLKTLNQCRENTPGGFRTIVSTLRSSVAREYLPWADIVMPNAAYPINEETIAEIRDNGCTLGLYNCGATRFSYGFYPWRVDAYTRAQWSFSYDGDSRDPFSALPSGARVSCDCHFTPEWEVLPSIGMLQQREGVDDYRYVQLLEELIQDAGDTPAARRANGLLEELRAAINMEYRNPSNNWDRSTMDYWRWRVAEAAMKLQGD